MANGVDKKQAVLNGQYYPMGWFALLMYIQLYSATTTIIRNPRDGPLALVVPILELGDYHDYPNYS
jgi:hypothetical protein